MIPQPVVRLYRRMIDDLKENWRLLRTNIAFASKSLVARMVFFALFTVFVGLVVRLVVLLPILKEQVQSVSASRQLSLAQYVANDISSRMRERVDVISGLASAFPAELATDPVRAEAWLAEHHKIFRLFTRGLILVPLKSGASVVDYPVFSGRRDLGFTQSEWFVEVQNTQRTVVGHPKRSRLNQAPILPIAAPVFDRQGQMVAVLVGVTALAAPGFLDLLQETRIGENGGFLLISPQDNLFLAATDEQKFFTPLPRPGVNALHDQAMAGYRGTGVTMNIHGVEELSAIASVPNTGWFLVARVPVDEIQATLSKLRNYTIRGTIFVGIVVVSLVFVFMRHYLGPLTTTSRLIHRMAIGEISLQPVPVKSNDEIGELATGFNYLLSRLDELTAQKIAAERERVEEKERIEVLLRQWMADTSHELRTPIAVLLAQIEAIQDGVHSANEKTLDVLHREVAGLSRLVDDLHTLALSDVDQFKCQSVPVAPLGVLGDVVMAFQDRFNRAGIQIQWGGGGHKAPLALIDPSHLRRVFSNLLENSLRYTDAGGRMEITASVAANVLTIVLDDTAPGVPAEAMGRLFERFFRVDPSRNRDFGGSGIGLSICETIVTAYGGTILAVSSPLGGLRVQLQFPIIEDET